VFSWNKGRGHKKQGGVVTGNKEAGWEKHMANTNRDRTMSSSPK